MVGQLFVGRFWKVLICCMLISVSCKDYKNANDQPENAEIEKTWHQFLEVVESGNKEKFLDFAASEIRCYECLENTPTEQRQLESLSEKDSLWYDKLYDDLIYIPADSFVKKDLNRFFTPSFLKILRLNETIYHHLNEDEMEIYEILVTTIEPTDEHEGMQHSFQFQKINGKWKFSEVSSIP